MAVMISRAAPERPGRLAYDPKLRPSKVAACAQVLVQKSAYDTLEAEQPFVLPIRVLDMMTSLQGATEVSPDPVDTEPAGSYVQVESMDGRDAEFSAFMIEAEPVLGRMAWLLCGDHHRAEELVQQALVRTYVAWPRAREKDPLAYSRRALTNLRIDSWRKHRKELLMAPEDLPAPLGQSAAQGHADRDVLIRALRRLSPRRRRVVVLRYLMDLSERQVADDLNISIGTVKSTASRGLLQLRAELGEANPHQGATPVPRPRKEAL